MWRLRVCSSRPRRRSSSRNGSLIFWKSIASPYFFFSCSGVSDNQAFNQLFSFVGHHTINQAILLAARPLHLLRVERVHDAEKTIRRSRCWRRVSGREWHGLQGF